ncbi:PQQ-dependent sugar dehydrogenase [Pseudactinotalea sp. HY160]|nr:PQQ-dependent sugar dehydrogenase [Pseudactinotalea sp. HY160]
MRPRWTVRGARAMAAVPIVMLLVVAGCSGPGPERQPERSAQVSASAPTPRMSEAPTTMPTAVPPPTPAEPVDIATGLEAPWSIVFVGTSALISERDSGRILELTAAGDVREVATVAGIVHGGEGGLLGMATDDDRLYVYSTGEGGNRVQRFALSGHPGDIALGAPETILAGIPAARVHNGGRIAFGPDGMLYVTTGDATERENAQDLDSLSGKILRMTPAGEVPADNPFPGSLVYSYGHRNVEGLAWSGDGTLFATEFGENTWDELNIITAGGNYGWPDVEGMGGGDGMTDPVQVWATEEASPSGIARSGDSLVIANLRGERLRVVPIADPATSTELFAGEYGRIRTVVPAPDGGLWFLTNNTDGRGDPRPGDDRIVAFALG